MRCRLRTSRRIRWRLHGVICTNCEAGGRSDRGCFILQKTDKCLSGKRRADLSFEEVEAELNPELLIEESADILKTLLEREQSDQIIAALNLLSPRYQSVVKLWAMGSLSQREIAKVMGMNRSTTRICLRRGLKAFRKAYASLNYESAESVKLQVQKREIRRKDEEQKAEEQPEIPC